MPLRSWLQLSNYVVCPRLEGEAYGRKLDEAGVKITSTRYNGMIHDWGLLNPLATVPRTKSAMLQAAAEIKNALK